jgi:hypothetical protein
VRRTIPASSRVRPRGHARFRRARSRQLPRGCLRRRCRQGLPSWLFRLAVGVRSLLNSLLEPGVVGVQPGLEVGAVSLGCPSKDALVLRGDFLPVILDIADRRVDLSRADAEERSDLRWVRPRSMMPGTVMVGNPLLILTCRFYDPLLAREPRSQVGKMSGRANRNAPIRSSAQACSSGDKGGSHGWS